MLTCPNCPDSELRHTLIAVSLPAHSCKKCKGLLISLVAYRAWRERTGIHGRDGGAGDREPLVSDTRDVIKCAKCSRLMTKYRVSADAPNRIDFCANCEEVWLDAGEWELIETLVGSDRLATITARPWQHRVTSDTIEKMEARRLAAALGDDYEKVKEIGDWLEDHPSRQLILAWLTDRSA
jgi:Zn-finger nucleic acid-binding protein